MLISVFCLEPSHPPSQDLKTEYLTLLSSTEDKIGLEAIRALHQQLDDDNDGTIEPSETGDFIKADLQVSHMVMGSSIAPWVQHLTLVSGHVFTIFQLT